MLTRTAVLLVACLCSVLAVMFPRYAAADVKCAGHLVGCLGKAEAKPKSTTKRVVVVDAGSKRHSRSTWTPPPTTNFSAYQKAAESGPPDGLSCYTSDVSEEACVTIFSTDPPPADPSVRYVTVTPYQAALMAVAYLPLQPGKPTVGPPPTLNKWKMAAVGYPLWIWAEGNLDPAPVTHTVSGLSVSLDASLAKIVYDLGDGTKITCGPGTPWQKGKVKPGTPSPDCGHTYTKPSLPKGRYTITATTHWSVAWTAGGESGTIPFTQTSTTTLPVGEVQTLVR